MTVARVRAFALALLLSAVAAVCAAEEPVYAEFMRKSGLWVQVGAMEASVRLGFDAAVAKFGPAAPAALDTVRRSIGEIYGAARMREAVRRQLASNLSSADLNEDLAWLATPFAQRVTAMEEAAASADKIVERARAADAKFASLGIARRKLLERMIEASDAAEMHAQIFVNQLMAVSRAIAAASGQRETDAATMAPQLDLLRAQLKGSIAPRLLADLALIYDELSDAELEQYLAFIESPAGRRTARAVNAALAAVLSDAAEQLGQSLVRAFDTAPPKAI